MKVKKHRSVWEFYETQKYTIKEKSYFLNFRAVYINCTSRHPLDSLAISMFSADEMGGGENYRGPAVRKGAPGLNCVAFLSFSVLPLSVDCTNQTLETKLKPVSATDSLSGLV